MRYTQETVRNLGKEALVSEFAQATMNSIARTDPNLAVLREELHRRLTPPPKKSFFQKLLELFK